SFERWYLVLKNPLSFSHMIVKSVVNKGDYVIDATIGNGHDTLFLAELVGNNGKVFGFDIQKQAIQSTKERLSKEKSVEQVELIHDGHENINNYLPQEKKKVSAVMFNLGYLPKGDKAIVTKAETTKKAINQALSQIKKGGIVSIMVYYGHSGTNGEKEAVDELVRDIPQDKFDSLSYKFVNQRNNPPYLYLIQRK
ncbi:MAG: class I SAM-dependent methyltransferase, partial [Atopostipes sp.]|nr:class I SAM-dependent methyltransferase [Atopostipes sp.]